MGYSHVLHRLRWFLIFDHLVVVSRDQSVERVAYEAETKVAAPVLAGAAKSDQLSLMIRFVLPEFVRGGFCSLGGHFTEQTAKGSFDRGICRFGNSSIEQVMALHPDEVVRLSHGSASFGEILFEELAKQLPFTPVEQGSCLDRQLKPPFVQARIGGFVQVLVVCVGLQLLPEAVGLLGQGLLEHIPQKGAGLLGIAGLLIVNAHDLQIAFAAQFREALLQLLVIGVGEISGVSECLEKAGFGRVAPFLEQLGVAGADEGLWISAGE